MFLIFFPKVDCLPNEQFGATKYKRKLCIPSELDRYVANKYSFYRLGRQQYTTHHTLYPQFISSVLTIFIKVFIIRTTTASYQKHPAFYLS